VCTDREEDRDYGEKREGVVYKRKIITPFGE
jgi:hypothetical protein